MSKKRSKRLSTVGAQLSTIISVSLVLLIVGLILVITSITSGAGDSMRRNMSVVLSLVPDASAQDIDAVSQALDASPYCATVEFVSADEVLSQEMEYNADIINALGHNPFAAEFDITLNPEYTDTDSVAAVIAALGSIAGVDEVYSQSDVVDSLNGIFSKITIVLAVIGLIVLTVSVILLFNTINLAIYSRRFIINTMQLVGATSGFIKRPFVYSGCLIGLVSGVIASAALCLLHYYLSSADLSSVINLSWGSTALICCIVVAIGMTGCMLAASWASSKYLRLSYDSLYTH